MLAQKYSLYGHMLSACLLIKQVLVVEKQRSAKTTVVFNSQRKTGDTEQSLLFRHDF